MKKNNKYRKYITGVIKDSIIVIFLFASIYFIDEGLAAAISFTVLLTRRIILYYNPGFIKGYHIYYNKKELTVAEEVAVFDLSKVPSIDYLYNYTEVIRNILIPPRIFIIQFCGIFLLKEFELDILNEVIRRLQSRKIIVILSDIEETIMCQFGWYKIENEVGISNIFFNISDALTQANKALSYPQ